MNEMETIDIVTNENKIILCRSHGHIKNSERFCRRRNTKKVI